MIKLQFKLPQALISRECISIPVKEKDKPAESDKVQFQRRAEAFL